MGVLDVFKRAAARVAPGIEEEDLFDEEFQRRLEYLEMVSKRVFTGAMKAERKTRKTGAGIEFADHREYAPGDDFRYLDFHAYQRFDKLLLRLFEEEEDLSIYFIVDNSWSMSFGGGRKLRYAKQLCAALAYVALANLDRVSVVAVNDEINSRMEPTRNKRRIFRVFQFLSRLEGDGATDLGTAMKAFAAQNKRRGLAVVLSDLYDPSGFQQGINVLRYNKFEPFVLHIVDPADAKPELKGDLRIYDCETGEEREVTVTKKVLEKFEEEWVKYQRRVQRFCVSRQAIYFEADITVPFDELILRVFRKGGFLR